MGMYRDILETEGTVLSEIITKQTKFKKAVNDKNWSCLMECISDLNELAEKFNALDERRAKIFLREIWKLVKHMAKSMRFFLMFGEN